jgi:hypothetical protein
MKIIVKKSIISIIIGVLISILLSYMISEDARVLCSRGKVYYCEGRDFFTIFSDIYIKAVLTFGSICLVHWACTRGYYPEDYKP